MSVVNDIVNRVEEALGGHPFVAKVKVAEDPNDRASGRLIAFVLPSATALEESAAMDGELIRTWRRVYDAAYTAAPVDATFDIGIWRDSYRNQPIPAAEMNDWTQETVDNILRLNHSSILEIGCGTGLLLFRLAPHCQRYTAYDISNVVVDRLAAHVNSSADLRHVEVSCRDAEVVYDLPDRCFDLVVLNSIVMYFPSASYVERILAEAFRITRPGGHVFVGDVRDARLLDLFALDVELANSGATDGAELLAAAEMRAHCERQLLLEPGFFGDVWRRHADVGGLSITLKRSAFENEMTRFRYDVCYSVADEDRAKGACARISGASFGLPDLKNALTARPRGALEVRGLHNRRLATLARVQRRLRAGADARVGAFVCEANALDLDPADIVELAAANGREVLIMPSQNNDPIAFDALFWPADEPPPSQEWDCQLARQVTRGLNSFAPQLRQKLGLRIKLALENHLRASIGSSCCLPEITLVDEPRGVLSNPPS